MKPFYIKHKESGRYFAEEGMGLCRRGAAAPYTSYPPAITSWLDNKVVDFEEFDLEYLTPDEIRAHVADGQLSDLAGHIVLIDILSVAEAALEWIDSVPQDTALPAMPGFDRDWANSVIETAKKEIAHEN